MTRSNDTTGQPVRRPVGHRRPNGAHASTGAEGSVADGIAHELSQLARALQADSSAASVMARIVRAAATDVPGASCAAITLLDRGRVSSPAHSDERASAIGLAEAELAEGPCVDSSRNQLTVRSDDLRTEQRWPHWASTAVAHGMCSVMSFQLFVEDDSMGALNIYGAEADAFDGDAENIALLLASHAAIAMANTRKLENLAVAVNGRDIIGQAKGILMERYKIGAQEAFDLLVYASQRLNRKLRDIAFDLAATGELPGRAQASDSAVE